MTSFRRSLSCAVTYTIMLSTAFADVVTLKNGEKIEGKVLKDKTTDQQVTLEVKVSGGVFDERIIPRTEIDHIDVASPETEAFKQILTVQTGPNSLTPAQYDPYIRLLQDFLKKYPNGEHAKEVQTTLNEFLAEKKRVEAGDVKLHAEWIPKEKAEKDKVQIDGTLAFEYMKGQAAAGDIIGALNTFVGIEKAVPGAAIMPDAIEFAKQLLAGLKPVVERAVPEQKVLKAEQEKRIADAGPAERAEMLTAYKAEIAQAEATATAADKTGNFPPIFRSSDKALKTLTDRMAKETTRIAGLNVEGMRKSLEDTKTAQKRLEAGELDAANAALKEAGTLWPANDYVKRLLAEVAAAKASTSKASATPMPVPATPAPKATPKKPAATPVKTSSSTAPAPEESSSIALPAAIAGVVVVAGALVGLNIYKKKKKGDGEVEIR
jgi:hypothetical protein